MKVDTAAEVFLQLREQRTWRLLAADKSPLYLAILQSVFDEETRALADATPHAHQAALPCPAQDVWRLA